MNDLDHLDNAGSDVGLLTPLSSVTARGTTLRNRRRARRASITLTAALALVGGSLAVRAATRPDTDTPRETDLVSAGWSASLNGLPAATSDAYLTLCRTAGHTGYAMVPEDQVLANDLWDSAPVASTELAGSTGPFSVLIFHDVGIFASCLINLDQDGAPMVAGMQVIPLDGETGQYVTPMGGFMSFLGDYGDGFFELAMGTTAPGVDSVRITIGGQQIGATVEGGVFAAVVPNPTNADRQNATVEAYDSDDTQLEQVPLH